MAGGGAGFRTRVPSHRGLLSRDAQGDRAFYGVDAADAQQRVWSDEARMITDDDPAVEAALRAYWEAARLGLREAGLQLARLSRASSTDNKRRALALLQAHGDPTAAELYQ